MKGYDMPQPATSPTIMPGENLVPKVPSMWSALALAIFPVLAVLFIGRLITKGMGAGEGQLSDIVSVLALITLVAGAANFFRVAVSILRKVFISSHRIANTLWTDHGIRVLRPGTLILKDGFKPRLNPQAIPAVDSHGRPITITVSTDSAGTRIVPTVLAVDGKRVEAN